MYFRSSHHLYFIFLSRVKINSINWPAPNIWVFIAQLVEHCSANAEAMGSNPVEALKFFSGLNLQLLKLRLQLRWSNLYFICISAVHIIFISNYLCLPHNPKYDKYKDGLQGSAYMYDTEYQIDQYSGVPFKRNLQDHDAPCVVCFVKSRGSVLMMPARNDCPSGWTEEYHGYLMTEHHGYKHSRDFVCVVGDPKYASSTHANNNGALLYPVEGVCGSLPCLPYVGGRKWTYAVCTR